MSVQIGRDHVHMHSVRRDVTLPASKRDLLTRLSAGLLTGYSDIRASAGLTLAREPTVSQPKTHKCRSPGSALSSLVPQVCSCFQAVIHTCGPRRPPSLPRPTTFREGSIARDLPGAAGPGPERDPGTVTEQPSRGTREGPGSLSGPGPGPGPSLQAWTEGRWLAGGAPGVGP